MTAVPLSAPPLGDRMDGRYGLGRQVVGWIETCCVFGEGDRLGQPVRLEPFQVDFLLGLFELRPDGRRRYRRALLECPKGNGKSPISAWVGAYELTHRDSASIPVAAASYEQAEVLFGDLRTCVRESAVLAAEVEAFEHEVVRVDGRGRAFKVAAVAGTNDGGRPTAFLADELHEWQGNKARVHLVLSNGCAKRAGSLVLNTTTPGFDADTLAGRLHEHGLQVNSGEVDDPEFLFCWYGCPEDRFVLDDPAGLREAIRAANPAADVFLDVEAVAARFAQVPRHEFLRYHLGLWTTVGEAWLPEGAWAACADPGRPHGQITDGSEVTLGFDGSFNNDSTALWSAPPRRCRTSTSSKPGRGQRSPATTGPFRSSTWRRR